MPTHCHSEIRYLRLLIVVLGLISWPLSAIAEEQPLTGTRDEAIAWFEKNMGGVCRPYSETVPLFDGGREEMPTQFVMKPQEKDDGSGDKQPDFVLFGFFCDNGAYNVSTAFIGFDGYEFKPLSLARPTLLGEEDEDGPKTPLQIAGFDASLTATNAEFDLKTRMLKEHGFWRGIGDASNETWWKFQGDRFVLTRYRVDATYDDKVNPTLDVSWK